MLDGFEECDLALDGAEAQRVFDQMTTGPPATRAFHIARLWP